MSEEAPLHKRSSICEGIVAKRSLSEISFYFKCIGTGAVTARSKPAVLAEKYGSQKNLSSKVVEGKPAVDLTEAKMKHKPVAVFVLDKVAVTYALNGVSAKIAVCEHWVVMISLKLAPNGATACVGNHMAVLGASLGSHKVVESVDFVHMGTFEISSP